MSEPTRRLVLVRHAAAAGQDPAAALTPDGERQARALADLLARLGVARVVASPFVRAVETARPFCARAGLALETDARLVERALGPPDLADWREHLRRSFDDLDYRLDGGESARAAQARGAAVVRDALASGARCALVTHGNLLALLLNAVDPAFGFDAWARLTNPDAFLLNADDRGPTSFTRVWA